MLRKIFVCALTAAIFCLVGCGGGGEQQKTSADKAVLAYAELIAGGESANMAAAGLTDADKKEIRDEIADELADGFKEVMPLTDQSANAVAEKFYAKFKNEMKFQTTLKKDDKEHPVVELKTTPINQDSANKAMPANDEFLALIGMVGQLKADGATDDQLKNNAELQQLAVTALSKYVEALTLQGEKTFDVVCKEVKGSDGKTHWAPEDDDALAKFILGQK